ncbi:MAG TPA: hypothetical protein PKC28_14675 [Bdellovibrionales bacterium]|nr:hypothetical protein [Bdellovibrionales bacterium]
MRKSLVLLFAPITAFAMGCPGEDAEPAFTAKTEGALTLSLCGFEDHEVQVTKGKRAFSEFQIFSFSAKAPTPVQVFTAEENETYWAKALPGKGIELEELWFFSEKPQPAVVRTITCKDEACTVSEPKCVFKMKKNPFPKALKDFETRHKAGTLGEDGEELIDQIFAQAVTGDKGARAFYETPAAPVNLGTELKHVYEANKKKLSEACKPAAN